MRLKTLVLAVAAGWLSSAAASAAPAPAASTQPPMGQFLGAYYTCDQGQAFEISYDSATPKGATVTTSNNDARYMLKRVAGAAGPQFSNGPVSISVTGNDARVQGTAIKLTDCKLKNTT
jgi:membrane-bound inhibitor of C-type lysozyme